MEKAGKPQDWIDRLIEIKVSFDTDQDRALNDTRFWGALALKPEEKMNVEDPLEMERLADALPVERAASSWIVGTDPQTIVNRLGHPSTISYLSEMCALVLRETSLLPHMNDGFGREATSPSRVMA